MTKEIKLNVTKIIEEEIKFANDHSKFQQKIDKSQMGFIIRKLNGGKLKIY